MGLRSSREIKNGQISAVINCLGLSKCKDRKGVSAAKKFSEWFHNNRDPLDRHESFEVLMNYAESWYSECGHNFR